MQSLSSHSEGSYHSNRKPLIRAREIYKVYQRGKETVEALRGVTMEIPSGAFALVIGPSGGGKSTLLHLLGGMDRPTRGALSVNGTALEQASEEQLTCFRRANIGFIFQFYNLLPSLDALENAALPLLARGWRRGEALSKAEALLAQVDLLPRMHHRPAELSGGEQQRVAVARAIAGEPSLVLADEPTGDLDTASAAGVMELMADLNSRLGITFIVATHNERLARYADHHYELNSGQLRGM